MLDLMRKNKKVLNIVLWLVIFAFLATIVVVWGIGDMGQANFVAKIDNEIISLDEYRKAYDSAINSFQEDGRPISRDSDFEKSVINDMVNRRVLLKEARRLKVPISDNEVRRVIETTPAFADNGLFNPDRYLSVLTAAGLTTNAYESALRDDLLLAKFIELAAGSVAVTEKEIFASYLYNYTEVLASYFKVGAPKDPYTAPDETEAKDYYEKVKPEYTIPAKIKLKYISFSPKGFSYTPDITEQMLQDSYAADITRYMIPPSFDLSHILVLVRNFDNQSDVEAAEEKINKALAELKRGASFSATAAKYSDDKSAIGGRVGRITKSDNPSEVEEKLFSLKAGEFSEVIRNSFGLQIFRADNVTEGGLTPFENVRGKIREELFKDLSERAYRDYLFTSYRNILRAGNITAYQAEHPADFKVEETGFMEQGNPSLAEELFTLLPADVSGIIDLGDTSRIYELTAREDSRVPPFEEVKAQVLKDYTDYLNFQKALKSVREKVGERADRSAFSTAARGFGAYVIQLPPFKRVDSLTEYPWLKGAVAEIFSKGGDETVIIPSESSNEVYVVRVEKVALPTGAVPELYKGSIAQSILAAKQAEAVEDLIAHLRAKYKVVIHSSYQ